MHGLTLELFKHEDKKYREFSKKLIPDTKYQLIGVRTPLIKNLAKTTYLNNNSEIFSFLQENHSFLEENLLHGLLLSFIKDIDLLLDKLNEFLPYIDNWAVCDCTVMALKLLKKHPDKTLNFVKTCLASNKPYTVRFGIVCLLSYFLDDNFNNEILELAKRVKSEHYYVNMGLAWFYSIALIKQYPTTIKIFENKLLPKFVHNKSLQKAIESFRINLETKNYLRTIKIK